MKKRILTIALMIPLILTSCTAGREDGFSSEAEKNLVWDVYKCSNYGEVSARSERMGILIDILGDNIPMDEIDEAERWERRLERVETVGRAMEYKDIEGVTDMCSGWLWERQTEKKSYMDGYEEFTAQDALDAGVIG